MNKYYFIVVGSQRGIAPFLFHNYCTKNVHPFSLFKEMNEKLPSPEFTNVLINYKEITEEEYNLYYQK
jgi:hypothetical protein